MFPRSNSVVRAGVVIAMFVFTVWLYLVVPPAVEPRDIVPVDTISISPRDFTQVTRAIMAVNASGNGTHPKQTHHHSNETLQKLASNMTVLKANKTVLQKIIRSVNESIIKIANSTLSEENSEILHPHPFNYVINAKNICHNKDIFLIVYIHTAPKHYKRRMVIRQTWGSPKYYDVNIRLVFVMGRTADPAEVQNSLYFESEQYGDIVQEDFLDSYKNLTYKGVASLKWISNHCRHAKFVLKTDDDIFVNMFTLLRHLKSRTKMGTNHGLLMCLVWYRMKVMRTGKWRVGENEFKDNYYPTYCSGSAFSMSTDVAVALHRASYYVPFFWVDDFYITGLLPMKAGVKHTQFMSTYILDGRKLEEKFTGPQWYTYIFSHVHNLNKIQSVWARLLELESGVAVPVFKFAVPLDPVVKKDTGSAVAKDAAKAGSKIVQNIVKQDTKNSKELAAMEAARKKQVAKQIEAQRLEALRKANVAMQEAKKKKAMQEAEAIRLQGKGKGDKNEKTKQS